MARNHLLVIGCALALGVRCTGGSNTSGSNTSGGNTSDGNTSGGNTSDGNTSDGNTSDGNTSGGNTSGGNTSGGSADSDSGGRAGTTGSGDTPYANVTAVSVTGSTGSYTFSVSVESADIDCTQYANWWEILREDGSLVFRRILEHSHTDQNGTSDADAPGNTFTRSGGPVAVAENERVVVAAHMSVGGYNGMVMRGSALEGFVTAPDIDASFAVRVEDEAPQPGGCLF